jgi:hypothetical protein
MKVGAKRRRSKMEIQQEKLEAAERARDIEEKMARYDEMEAMALDKEVNDADMVKM